MGGNRIPFLKIFTGKTKNAMFNTVIQIFTFYLLLLPSVLPEIPVKQLELFINKQINALYAEKQGKQ